MPEYKKDTHVWIAIQAVQLLPQGPFRDELTENLGSYEIGDCDDVDSERGSTLLQGVWAADCGLEPLDHFWDPDRNAALPVLGPNRTAVSLAQQTFDFAVQVYGDSPADTSPFYRGLAYYHLGKAAHLLMDMAQPGHVHLDRHLSIHNLDWLVEEFDEDDCFDLYEARVALIHPQYKARDMPLSDQEPMRASTLIHAVDAYTGFPYGEENSQLFWLFFNLAETTDFFESEDVNGDGDGVGGPVALSSADFGALIDHSASWPAPANPSCDADDGSEPDGVAGHAGDPSRSYARKHADVLLPLAFRYVAGLYELFWEETACARAATTPRVTAVEPAVLLPLPAGQKYDLVVRGSSFPASPRVSVWRDGQAELLPDAVRMSDSEIHVSVDLGPEPQAWNLKVGHPDCPSNLGQFSVGSPPVIESVRPTSVDARPWGERQVIRLLGTGFTRDSTLTFSAPGIGDLENRVPTYLGSRELQYSASLGPDPRNWTVRVVNDPFESNALPVAVVGCSVGSDPPTGSFGAAGGQGSVHVLAGNTCAWTATTVSSWIHLGSGSGSGTGPASIIYTVDPNAGPTTRVGTVLVGAAQHVVNQAGGSCTFALSRSVEAFTASGGPSDVRVDTSGGCAWAASTTDSWITLTGGSGTGTGLLTYSVAPAPDAAGRVGFITVQGATLRILQNGQPCEPTVLLAGASFNATGWARSVSVAAAAGCAWSATTSDAWITPDDITHVGNGAFTYQVTMNTTGITRIGEVSVGSTTHRVEQAGLGIPGGPSPVNGATDVSRQGAVLSWASSASSPVEHAIRFGTGPSPGFYASFGTVTGTSYQVPYTMQPGAVYYWGVSTRDADGVRVDSPIWSFTTEYAYPDLAIRDLAIDGPIEPNGAVTVNLTARNEGSFDTRPAWLDVYLSRTAGARESRLNHRLSDRVNALAPGAEQAFSIPVTLDGLQAGESFIEAWLDTSSAGSGTEQSLANNNAAVSVTYSDASIPEVTYVSLHYGLPVRTGHSHPLVYSAQDDVAITRLDFYYSLDGGTTWAAILEGHVPEHSVQNGASIQWDVPANIPPTEQLHVRVVASDASGNSGTLEAGPSELWDGSAPAVTVVSPNGGEAWDMGTSHEVTWSVTSANEVVDQRIYLRHDGTREWLGSAAADEHSFTWNIREPFSTQTGQIEVEVQDIRGNEGEDQSDTYFSIRDTSAPPPAPWRNPGTLASLPLGDTGGLSAPRLAVSTAGELQLVYLHADNGAVGTTLSRDWVLHRQRSGDTWSEPFTVHFEASDKDGDPGGWAGPSTLGIAAGSDGESHVAWLRSSGVGARFNARNEADIFVRSRISGVWGEPVNISDSIRGDSDVHRLDWQAGTPLLSANHRAASAVLRGRLHVIGGSPATRHEVYDPGTNAWTSAAAVPASGIHEGRAVTLNDRLYAVGNSIEGRIKIYDPNTDSWSEGAAMPTVRQRLALAAVNGKLYALGGSRGTANEVYAPSTNSWEQLAPLPRAHDGSVAAVHEGKIHLLGLSPSVHDRTVDIYDPATDTWTSPRYPAVAQPPVSEQGCTVAADGRVIVLGGWDGFAPLRSVEEYDPANRSWTRLAPMATKRTQAACALIGDTIYVAGGHDGANRLSSMERATLTSARIGCQSFEPALAIGGDGSLHVVWRDGGWYVGDTISSLGFAPAGESRYFHTMRDASGNWSTPTPVGVNGSYPPSLTADSEGGIHLGVVGHHEQYLHLTWEGDRWSEPTVVSHGAGDAPALGAGEDGRLAAAWHYYDAAAGGDQLWSAAFDGSTWSPAELVSNQRTPQLPSISVDGLGRTQVIWETWAWPDRLVHSTLGQDGWSTPTQLHQDSMRVVGWSSDAALSQPNDSLHAVWASRADGGSAILHNWADVSSAEDVHPPSVSVAAPHASQVVAAGGAAWAEWNAVDAVGVASVDLDLSLNGGETWVPLGAALENDGIHEWSVPTTPSETARIRVTARDAADNSAAAESGLFIIADLDAPQVVLGAPAGGAVLLARAAQDVTWMATDTVGVASVRLDYSVDGGVTWESLASDLTASGSVSWEVPDVVTDSLLVAATAVDDVGHEATATTAPELTVVRANQPPDTPHGGLPANGVNGLHTTGNVLSWQAEDADGDELLYSVRFGTEAEPALVATDLSAPEHYTGELELGTTYYWQAAASDGTVEALGPIWSFRTAGLPLPPAEVVASDGVFADRIVVTWSPVAEATHYEVWRSPAAAGQRTAVLVGETDETRLEDHLVSPEEHYTYSVRAVNELGTSAESPMDEGHRLAADPALDGAPMTLGATDVGQGETVQQILHVWNAGDGVLHVVASVDADWVSITPIGATVADLTSELTLTFDASELTEGVHRATVSLRADEAVNSVLEFPVSLQVLPSTDRDGDGVGDLTDNCADVRNADQMDQDADGIGNACDNCADADNPGQEDSDGNGIGDACDFGACHDGDVHPRGEDPGNGGRPTLSDAGVAYHMYLGLLTPTAGEFQAADVHPGTRDGDTWSPIGGDGPTVTLSDAAVIFHAYLGLLDIECL